VGFLPAAKSPSTTCIGYTGVLTVFVGDRAAN